MIVAIVRFERSSPISPDGARASFEASAPNYQNLS